jgi:hypothetical protein
MMGGKISTITNLGYLGVFKEVYLSELLKVTLV